MIINLLNQVCYLYLVRSFSARWLKHQNDAAIRCVLKLFLEYEFGAFFGFDQECDWHSIFQVIGEVESPRNTFIEILTIGSDLPGQSRSSSVEYTNAVWRKPRHVCLD